MDVMTYLQRIEAHFDSPPKLEEIFAEAERDDELEAGDMELIDSRVGLYLGEDEMSAGEEELVELVPEETA